MRLGIRMGRLALVALLLALIMGTITAPGLTAFQAASGSNVVIQKEQTVRGDFYSAATTTIVDGTVTGDLVTAGGSVIVNGRVEGSVISVGDTLTINGPVGGNIRGFHRSITINSTVGKNLTIAGESALLGPSAKVGGGVIGGLARLESQADITDDVKLGVDTLRLGGRIGGSARIGGESITLLPDARIDGRLTYYGPRPASIPGSARVAGGVTYEPTPRREMMNLRRTGQVIAIGWSIGMLLLGMLLWAVYPEKMRQATEPLRATWTRGFLMGLAGLVAGPIAVFLAFATLVGAPVAVVLLGLYLFGLLFTLPLSGSLLARQLESYYFPGRSTHPLLLAVLGMAGILLLRLLPFFGPLIGFLSMTLGFGLLLQALNPIRTVPAP